MTDAEKITALEEQIKTLTQERDEAKKQAEGDEMIRKSLDTLKARADKMEAERDAALARIKTKDDIISTLLNGAGSGGSKQNSDDFIKSLKL